MLTREEIRAVYDQGPEAVIALVEQLCAQVQLATAELDPELDPFRSGGEVPDAMDIQEPEHHARPEDVCLSIAEAESAGHARDRGGRTPPRSPSRPKARGELPGVNARKHPSPGWTPAGARTERGSGRARHRPHGPVDRGGRLGPRDLR